ncbi:MAG: oxidoreductase, partial [Clostridiales bacterium]|nr:oxidoreductase [Clostridiales bacterium]
ALLGTDMERVCRRAEERVGLPVRPCYMYALTREGRRPPMVHVRQSVYSLLEPASKYADAVNLLGQFSPYADTTELYPLLKSAGIRTVREIARCQTYAEYQAMAEANFNLVLHPEARPAADDFEKRLRIPYVELRRMYQTDKIRNQYQALGAVLGTTFALDEYEADARRAISRFRSRFPDAAFAVGEWMNGDAFELSLALVREGFAVKEIFGTVTKESFFYLKHLARLSPETRIFSNLEPSMLHYDSRDSGVTVTVAIGRDAAFHHPDCPGVQWNEEIQPFGYDGVKRLFEALSDALSGCEK